MCDTLGMIAEGKALFAKNSDRSPNEPQVSEYYPARDPQEPMLKATYLTIDQVAHTYACLLSRPTWMWGAEIGVNERGVCIGNEAVFTKGAYAKNGLTGMDLLRFGLERGATAAEARDVIIELLERHGQGGNCGHDHNFFYDNSFLIMDRKNLFVLETADKQWAYQAYPRASISNRLTLGKDADKYSGDQVVDFKKKFSDPLFTFFSGSKARWGQTCSAITQVSNVQSLFKVLRQHEPGVDNPLCQASLTSPCMHAGGPVGDHTTASMVVELDRDIKVWLTGSSTPCISLFKPWRFGDPLTAPIVEPNLNQSEAYWQAHEAFHRSVIGKILPEAFYQERDALEVASLAESEVTTDWAVLTEKARVEEARFYARWTGELNADTCGSRSFKRYWEKKNLKLAQPR